MSVSSHLNPEPERRLWIMHGSMRRAIGRTEIKLGGLMAFSAAQMALIKLLVPGAPLAYPSLALLSAVLLVGLIALSPFIEVQRQLPALDPRMDKRHATIA